VVESLGVLGNGRRKNRVDPRKPDPISQQILLLLSRRVELPSMRYLLFSILALSAGCRAYVEVYSVAEKIAPGKSVGLAVIVGEGRYLRSGKGSFLESAAIAYIHQNRSQKLKVLDAEEMGIEVIPKDEYSTMGSLEGGTVKGGEGNIDRIIGWNEVREGTLRVEAGIELFETYGKKWNLDYIILLWHPGGYHFRARVIKVENKEIIADVFAQGNAAGWGKYNAFPGFEAGRKGTKGLKYLNLSGQAKAALVFVVRLTEAILSESTAGGRGGRG
jgi:hypothetical protein